MVEECIFFEETSRGLAPITAYSTALTAGATYLRWGTEQQKRDVVGQEGLAWPQLMRGLSIERLIIAAMSLGAAERSLVDTLAYVSEREQFGRTIGS